jgi:peptidoglycan/xylan/chitin deacetylase (PgdA/CDA1 family)
LRTDLLRAGQTISRSTTTAPRLVRPPFGNQRKVFAELATELELTIVLWSVDPQDWRDDPGERVAARILKIVTPGAIVLLHDSGPRRPAVTGATRIVLRALSERGFEFVTVSELIDASPEHGRRVAEGSVAT